MSWLWLAFAILLLIAGIRAVRRVRAARRRRGSPAVDDAAVRRILEDGTFEDDDDDDEPLDLDEAARAEDEFWSETWDEPEEYGR